MVSMRTIGAAQCLRANGCTSRCTHLCNCGNHVAGEDRRRRKRDLRGFADADQAHRGRRPAFAALAQGAFRHRHDVEALEQHGAARLRQLDVLRPTIPPVAWPVAPAGARASSPARPIGGGVGFGRGRHGLRTRRLRWPAGGGLRRPAHVMPRIETNPPLSTPDPMHRPHESAPRVCWHRIGHT